MFKLIPHCAKGSWVVSQSVGTTPVILGRKLVRAELTSGHVGTACTWQQADPDVDWQEHNQLSPETRVSRTAPATGCMITLWPHTDCCTGICFNGV